MKRFCRAFMISDLRFKISSYKGNTAVRSDSGLGVGTWRGRRELVRVETVGDVEEALSHVT